MNLKQKIENDSRPQVKVCGFTRVEEALECAALGVDAIGCVFFPKSPRHVTENQARKICMAVSGKVKTVGVFVNETFDNIMQKVNYCCLDCVQLHGGESPELVSRLVQENILVIKALFAEGSPSMEDAANYKASAYLVECGKGRLPGGNALEWNWEKARDFGKQYPFILAGGLAPENIAHALTASAPDAVDVSSGVESSPGRKDSSKVKSFMEALSLCSDKIDRKNIRRIF
ncbi:MAG: phosphoribosylanthranilate isomerase [Thermodesulfobacteriota bacterium]|nr:phosphoribosylanthranilate isomerase [Thermodesulfobacteriota bacterium]